jgi:hypothetical protein
VLYVFNPGTIFFANHIQFAEMFKIFLLLLHQQPQQIQTTFKNTLEVQSLSRMPIPNATLPVQEMQTITVALATNSPTTLSPRTLCNGPSPPEQQQGATPFSLAG